MYEFQYDCVKPKYSKTEKLCYMDSFIVYIKTDDIYKDIAQDVETWFDTLQKRKNKKMIGVKKDELDGKIMKEFVGLREKTKLLHRQHQ